MAKGQQRSNKEQKKPKKDKTPALPVSPFVNTTAAGAGSKKKK